VETNGQDIVVGIADIKVGRAPSTLKTNLGSCIAVCLYDQHKKVGGMLHLMLASSNGITDKRELKKEKYADTGIAELLQQMKLSFGSLS
jgi:chemotaxis protein CheD